MGLLDPFLIPTESVRKQIRMAHMPVDPKDFLKSALKKATFMGLLCHSVVLDEGGSEGSFYDLNTRQIHALCFYKKCFLIFSLILEYD